MPSAITETRSEIQIHAPPAVVYNTLWDMGRYPAFITDVIDSKVMAGPSANHLQVRQHIRIIRAVELGFEVEGDPPQFVQWRLSDGADYLARHEGSWTVEPSLDSRSSSVVYRVRFAFVEPVPDAVIRRLVDFSVPTMLRQIKARAEFMARRLDAMF
ncbi:MAG TPA: hypothetical protein DCQ06_12395 [Myxococcales bacterium]|nr:hypothetical protein [Myxococcales bacterium]HAN32386.1 hypothetical protein [Myxococcales bacterium]|tara:strand:+ start:1239 stop:1709 length:471 start_codon:yes stop_codon:yes gene_type:complete